MPSDTVAAPAIRGASGPQPVRSASERDPVAASMAGLPRPLAAGVTLLSGHPIGTARAPGSSPTRHLGCAAASFATGVAVTWLAVLAGGMWWLAVPVGWAVTVHGLRNLRMMIYHQCAHRNMWRNARADSLLGRFLAAFLVVQHFESYSAEHVVEHHAVHHMTLRDPTVQAMLVTLRLRPGMSRAAMRRAIARKILSPAFHARFLIARLRSYLGPASAAERVSFLCVVGALVAVSVWLQAWTCLVIAWALPLTVFYQISNTLRLCVKHTFPAAGETPRRDRAYFAGFTNAVFLGEALPACDHLRQLHWCLKLIFIHFPARYLVLTGDTVVHDFHHRHPQTRDWPNYIAARAADDADGHPGWPPYTQVWGLVPAIDRVLDSLRIADRDYYDPARLPDVDSRSAFLAFDD